MAESWKSPVVIIPHVGWRRDALLELLGQLSGQTLRPRVIVLYDNTQAPEDPTLQNFTVGAALDRVAQRYVIKPSWWPKNLKGGVAPGSATKAQCERWALIEQIAEHDASPDGVLVLTLDDDMIIDQHYVMTTVKALLGMLEIHETTDIVLSWGGVDLDYHWRHYHEVHGPCQLVLPQSGAMAFYADTFAGLRDTALARKGHVRGGSEEVPVAAFLHERGITIRRPFGPGPQPHKLAYDDRSSYRTTQQQFRDLLQWTSLNTAWPHAHAIEMLLLGKRPQSYKKASSK